MSTDGKANPPRRPPTAGGAASRPAPAPGGRPAPARPAPVRSAPPQRPSAPVMEDPDDEKTAAFNIEDMGLDADDEKTAAFNIDDLPLDDAPPARQPQRTLVGHPVLPKAASPRAAPVRSTPPRAVVSGRPTPVEDLADQDEATQAMNVDAMLAAIEGDDDDDEKTSALSLEDIQQLNTAPPRAGKATPKVDLIDADQPTVGVKLSKPIASAPARPAAAGGVPTGDGFIGSIEYFFRYESIKARAGRGEIPSSAVSDDVARKGLINAAMVGGGLLALTLLAGIIA